MSGFFWVRDEAALDDWLQPVVRKDWCINVQAAPPKCQGPTAVLNYLAGYVVGTAIRNDRILRHDGRCVVIRVKNYRTGQYEELPLTGEEFVERFALHILPRGLMRVRFVGLFSPNLRRHSLQVCRQLLGVESPDENEANRDLQEAEAISEQTDKEQATNALAGAGGSPLTCGPPKLVPDCRRCGMPGMQLEVVCTPHETQKYLWRLRWLCDRMFTFVLAFDFGVTVDNPGRGQWIVAPALDETPPTFLVNLPPATTLPAPSDLLPLPHT